jgi:hypothetical protein
MTSLQEHWNKAYKNDIEKLGWYQEEASEILKLIDALNLAKTIRIHLAGAGRTSLVKSLVDRSFSNLTLSDISNDALGLLKADYPNYSFNLVQDDLGAPVAMQEEGPFDLWIDRAVLHFLTEEQARQNYFALLKEKTNKGACVLLAQFKKGGAKKCSGLEVCQYDLNMYNQYIGKDFLLLESFDYTFINPNGDARPYIYALYQKR